MLRPVTVTGLSADDYNRFRSAAKARSSEVHAAREVFLAGLDAPAAAERIAELEAKLSESRATIKDCEVYTRGLQLECSGTMGLLSERDAKIAELEAKLAAIDTIADQPAPVAPAPAPAAEEAPAAAAAPAPEAPARTRRRRRS